MSAAISPRSISFTSVLVCCVAAVLFAAATASAQTGPSTARLTNQQDEFASAAILPGHLSRLDSQPHLARHLTRINRFRTMFRTAEGRSSEQPDSRSPQARLAPPPTPVVVVPRAGPEPAPDAADLAILELEESMSARRYPSQLYPGVGLVVALKTISAWSEQSMIRALHTGAIPIYNQSGDVIGVEDADTGLLLGGRRS
ncbi:MAG: hypothetical protein ACPG36_09285 [Candidatus Puniceispirillaceae bacterium]